MKYLYLLYADESKMPHPGTPGFDAQNEAFNNYFAEIDGKGIFKAGDPVQGSSSSKTVRVRSGSTAASPGPFVHGGDQIVGYYLVECKDMDEAVKYAARCPAALGGAVEVRPILQM